MGAKRVGQRIHVYWTDETAWFSGVVQQYSPTQGYYVVYDDGDERWEGPNESYRFDGQHSDSEGDEDEHENHDDSNDHESRAGGLDGEFAERTKTTPRAMEPPASDEEDYGEEEQEGTAVGENPSTAMVQEADTDDGEEEEEEERERGDMYPKPIVLRDEEHGNDTHSDEEVEDEDDTRSVALTEVPVTHEPPATGRKLGAGPDTGRVVPHRGILRGVVVDAMNLPLVGEHEPTAFARIAFVEGTGPGDLDGRRPPSVLMLRCKQTLAATQQSPRTRHPVWNDSADDDSDCRAPWNSSDDFDGLFQLQVMPPMVVTTGAYHPQVAWHQLKGDLLVSVHHQEQDASQRSEFIGQATVPLHLLVRDLLSPSNATPCVVTTQHLMLETRQGKPIAGGAAVTIRLQFQPEYAAENRRPISKSTPTSEVRQPVTTRTARSTPTPSVTSSKARPKSASGSTRVVSAGAKQQPTSRPHQSSSEINRRRFEKQLESENKALAKRMAEQRRDVGAIAARRQMLNHQPLLIKSEPKPGIVAVKTAPPRSHKASSAINRNKFVEQVKQDNKSMGKRLVERAGLGTFPRRSADIKRSDELDWDDDKAQDKAHVADKRRVLRQEKDYMLEKAQAKYQQQNELVEEVMALQADVAEWKAKLFAVKSNLQRVDAMNTKDTHVRDCLQRAAAKTKRESPGLAPAHSAARLEEMLGSDDEDGDSDPGVDKLKRELRELLKETASLESEQHRLEGQINELTMQEAEMERCILDLHRKWQFVQAKRAFQTKMAADRANSARAVFTDKEMRAKKKTLELSAEEEEQYAIFQAQEELTQMQIAATVLKDRVEKGKSGSLPRQTSSAAASTAACDHLRAKIEKRKAKIASLKTQQSELRKQYEELVVSGEYDRLRAHAQELQHLLFLCQSEAKHVAAAERVATYSKNTVAMELQQQRFLEQTATDILLKRGREPKSDGSSG